MQKRSCWQFIADFIRRDFWRKAVALFLALLLYLAVNPRTGGKTTKNLDVPVTIELPSNLVLSSNEVRKVNVTFSGYQKHLDEIDPGVLRVRAKVHSNSFIAGEPYQLRLRHGDVSGTVFGTRVTAISPRDLILDLEQVKTKRLPIRARYDSVNKLLHDYEVAGATFVPATVIVSGPARVIDSMEYVDTEPIPLNEQVIESFDYTCALRLQQNIRCDRQEVTANVEINKVMTTHTFSAVPLLIIQSAERTRKFQVTNLDPETITVVANGPRGVLSRMHSREFSASISLDKIDKPGTYDLPVSIAVAKPVNGVTIKNFRPVTARVTVQQE